MGRLSSQVHEIKVFIIRKATKGGCCWVGVGGGWVGCDEVGGFGVGWLVMSAVVGYGGGSVVGGCQYSPKYIPHITIHQSTLIYNQVITKYLDITCTLCI